MANPIDLTTLEAVKLFLTIDNSDTSADSELAALITAASAFAANYCSRNFFSQTYEKTFNGQGSSVLMLGQSPVTAVSSVMVDGVAVVARPSVQAGGYVFDDDALYITGACQGFTRGLQNVQVTFVAGYADIASIPADLQQAVIDLVALKWKRRTNLDVASRGIAGETISYVTADMTRATKTTLNMYQKAYPG